MVTHKKLSPRRLSDIPGPRRKKPPIRRQNAELKSAILAEHETLQLLIKDAKHRKAVWLATRGQLEPLVVWNDFDLTYRDTEINPNQLPPWDKLTEYMKLQMGFLVAMEFGGYSFTCNVPDDLLKKWDRNGTHFQTIIQKRCRRSLENHGLTDLLYAYVIEGRSRSGKSRAKLHLHGYIVAENPIVATKFKMAMEKALLSDRNKRLSTSSSFDIQRAYDVDTGDGRGYGRWVNYVTKNVSKYDARIRGRRVFISRSLTQTAREFWALLCTDPFGE